VREDETHCERCNTFKNGLFYCGDCYNDADHRRSFLEAELSLCQTDIHDLEAGVDMHREREAKYQSIWKLKDEYIALLTAEIDELTPIAKKQGWKTNIRRYRKAKRIQLKIWEKISFFKPKEKK
jgi:hypothetical protein